MASGHTDLSEYAVNDDPFGNGFTQNGTNTAYDSTIIDGTTSPSGNAWRINRNDVDLGSIIVAEFDASGSHDTTQVLLLARQEVATDHNWGGLVRVQGDVGYATVTRNNTTDIRVRSVDNDLWGDDLAIVAHTVTDKTGWYWLRAQVDGTALNVSAWDADPAAGDFGVSDEPASWQVDITDLALTGAGTTGFYFRPSGSTTWVDIGWFGWATAGDTAPGPSSGSFGTPTGLTVTVVSDTQLDVAWDEVTGASGYDLERDDVIILTDHASTSYSDTGLTQNTEYTYRVRAVK